jgi:hypothetical protein
VLQALWAVAPTSLAWDAARQQPVENHLWAVGFTPFGALGAGSRLSFVQV